MLKYLTVPLALICAGCASQSSPPSDAPGALLRAENLPEVLTNVEAAALTKQPRPIRITNPAYPEELRRSGIKGTVVVQFVVSVDGSVVRAEVVSSPHPALSASAIEAIRNWRFEPGEKGGRKVNCLLSAPITFELPSGKAD